MRIRRIFLLGCCLACLSAYGQRTYNSIARDTIIIKPGFITNVYLLDGKRLNLQVMDFFMADHPSARARIKGAMITDQVSIVGYSVGGLFLITGFLVSQTNPGISRDLYLYGSLGAGGGLIFQLISNNFRKEAVYLYNDGIKAYYRNKGLGLSLQINATGLRIGF